MAEVEINDLSLKGTPVSTDEFEGQATGGGASFKATRAAILAIGTDTQAHSAVLDATTASFLTTDETKLDGIEELADVTSTHETSHSDVVVDDDIGSTVQAYDAGLLSIAGLTTAADKMIYTTALDTYAVIDLTAAGRALLDDADASAQRTTLGLEIGADVQAYDVDTAKTDVAQEYTATQNFDATTLTDGANISWDASANQVASVTLGGNRTLDNPTNMVDGATYILTVKQDATGTRTLAYGTAYKWAGGTAPTLTTTASAVDILTFICDGTSMYGVETLDFS